MGGRLDINWGWMKRSGGEMLSKLLYNLTELARMWRSKGCVWLFCKRLMYFMKSLYFPLVATVMMSATAFAAPDGEQLFTMNCSACHLMDEMVVGPSLAEMRDLYEGKPDEFVQWAIAPEKKRDGVIEMPSMVHVGEEGLRAIYAHVMEVSKGAVEQVMEEGDPYEDSPTQVVRPQIQRIFMPDAGPAAIAIALDEKVSLCWDAGECRLRYSWTGDFIDGFPYWKGNGSKLAEIRGDVRYVETSSPFERDGEVKFGGYRVEDGLPILRYRVGERRITETYGVGGEEDGFTRKFTMDPPLEEDLVLSFPSDQKVQMTSDKGEWSGRQLRVRAEDTSEFTITTIFQ